MQKVETYEQARNKALEILGDLGPGSEPHISRLKASKACGLVDGRQSLDGKKLWRLDFDPIKGPHINIENWTAGKRDGGGVNIAIPFDGDENLFMSLLKHLNK